MVRIALMIIWLLLSAWLLIWVGEGLFGHDQSSSILPFRGEDTLTAPIMIGVAWGIALIFLAIVGPRRRRLSLGTGQTQTGVGTIVEIARTGMEINDVPQYDVYVRVRAADGTEFVGSIRTLIPADQRAGIDTGSPLAVHYDPRHHDSVTLADPSDPSVRDALLEWRRERGLIDPRQVRARKSGIQVPASVLEVRPTGRRKERQVELALRVLMAPEDQASWEAETTVFVYPEAVSRLQVGSPIWAFYNREDPQTVAITIEKEEGR